MYKGSIAWAILNRKVTIFLVIIALGMGLWSFYISPKQEYPDLKAPVGLITAIYMGASPLEVEQMVIAPIEEMLKEIEGFGYSNSYSNSGYGIVFFRLEQSVDIDKSFRDIEERLNRLEANLPEGIDISLNKDLVSTAGILYSISSESRSYEELEVYAKHLREELSKTDGIERFEVVGAVEEYISIILNTELMYHYGLDHQTIANSIIANLISIPSGSIELEGDNIDVSIAPSIRSIDDLKKVIIAVSHDTGKIMYLEDISSIELKQRDDSYRVRHNGKPSVVLAGYFKDSKNILLIGDELTDRISEFESRTPKDVIVDKILFQPDDVSAKVSSFLSSLIQGIVFVIVVVFIGMGIRNAIIVSLAIPLSILMSFILMYILGIKVHQISISALIVALGMLVDNAIVISDSIQVKLDEGIERLEACIVGVKEVAMPVFTSTLTTIAAFMPLLLLPSIAGEYIRSLPQIVIISLTCSYIVAIFVTPSMAYIFFRPGKGRGGKYIIRKGFNFALKSALNNKTLTIIILLAVVGSSYFIVDKLNLSFFPKADSDIVYIDMVVDDSRSIIDTKTKVYILERELSKFEEVLSVTISIGNGLPKFYNTLPVPIPKANVAQALLRVSLADSQFQNNGELVAALSNSLQKIEDVRIEVKELEMGEPISNPVRVRIFGDEYEELLRYADTIKAILGDIEGTVNVGDDRSIDQKALKIYPDNEKATLLGISNPLLQDMTNLLLMGRNVGSIRGLDKSLEIVLSGDISTKEDLASHKIFSPSIMRYVSYQDIASFVIENEPPEIKRYSGERSILVYADLLPGYGAVSVQRLLEAKVSDLDLGNVSIKYDGEYQKILENFGDVGSSAILAIILIYLILLIQFKSLLQPIIILVTVPLSAVGSALGLLLFGQNLSFTAILGIVSLIGIVVNNAIVLIDYINYHKGDGMSVDEACKEATDKRFRPIIISTLTTVIGLVPLVLSGSELFAPQAIALMSGLLVSTLLTLIIIPVVYRALLGNR